MLGRDRRDGTDRRGKRGRTMGSCAWGAQGSSRQKRQGEEGEGRAETATATDRERERERVMARDEGEGARGMEVCRGEREWREREWREREWRERDMARQIPRERHSALLSKRRLRLC